MALEVARGTLAKETSGVNDTEQTVSGLSFQPKAIIISGSLLQGSAGQTNGHASFSIGFSDGTNNRAIGVATDDALGTSDTSRVQDVSDALIWRDAASTIYLAYASISFTSDGFTIKWKLASTDACLLSYVVFGGTDIEEVEVGSIGKTGTGSTSHTVGVKNVVAGEGIVFFATIGGTSLGRAAATNIIYSFGCATDTTEEWSTGHHNRDNLATTENNEQFKTDACVNSLYADASYQTANFEGFDADGFDLNWTTNQSGERQTYYMIIKGGRWQAGNDTVKITSTGTKAHTTNFKPQFLLTSAMPVTSTTLSTTADMSIDVGIADATTNSSNGITSEDAVGTTNTGRHASTTKCLRVMNVTPAALVEADIDSFNPNDFTLDYTTVDGSNAYLFGFVVCAGSAQLGRPISDQSVGSWEDEGGATTNLYQSIDEAVASDSDYIRSELNPATNSKVELNLTSLTDPVSSDHHVVRYRYQKDSVNQTIDLIVRLKQGATTIASKTHSGITTTWTDGAFVLSGAEADNITDYTDLRIEFDADVP